VDEPGVRQAGCTPESIGAALAFVLSREGRRDLASGRDAFLEAYNDGPPGKAADKIGRFVLEILEERANTPHAPPPGYYDTPRSDLLPLLPERATRILEVGCGAGATGRLLRERYPDARLVGIEVDPGAAEAARAVYDAVIQRDLEELEAPELLEVAGGCFDLVLYPDVLEHLRNPWGVLRELRKALVEDAVVIASIPNVANILTIYELRHGRWPYAPDGLFDRTHLRFFGRTDAVQLFESTGYSVEALHRIPAIPLPRGRRSRWDYVWRTFSLREICEEERLDLETFQFHLVCRPTVEGALPASRTPSALGAAAALPPVSTLRRVHWGFLCRSARYGALSRLMRRVLARWGILDLPDYPGDFFVR
jgi:SAM-dependent methyltransferase